LTVVATVIHIQPNIVNPFLMQHWLQYYDVSVGAHDLILHILEPSLEQRATLRDIASHPWLHDRPRQDPDSPHVISSPDSSDSGLHKHTRDSIEESTDKSSPVSDSSRMHFYSDYHGTVARVSVASSFNDSLSLWENDSKSLSVSRSCGVPPVIGDSSHCIQDKVISGDYIPLCDNSRATDSCRQSSRVITSSENFCETAGDELISNLVNPSNFYFLPTSSHDYCYRRQISDVGQVISQDGPSLVVSVDNLTTDTTKLPISYSADSLEVFADGHSENASSDDSKVDEYHDCNAINVDGQVSDSDSVCSDNDGGDDSHCENYDFADIDAVLDCVASDIVASVGSDDNEGSQVSHDSLEDAV